MGFVEMIGILSVIPFISTVIEPNNIFENIYLYKTYKFLKFNEFEFIIFLCVLSFVTLIFSNIYIAFMNWKIFKITRGQHPILVKTYLAKRVSLETLCILNDLLNYTKNFSKEIKETIIWPTLNRKITKYGPFLTYSKERMKLNLKKML